MRRTSLALLGITLLLHSLPAFALSPECEASLSAPPVSSHYVGAILARAEAALSAADSLPADPDFATYLPAWIQTVFSTAVALIDTTTSLTMNVRSLKNDSACLAFDAFLLKCEIRKTIESIHRSFTDPAHRSSRAIDLKKDLLPFLQDRLQNLLQGAYDPTYADVRWNITQAFDSGPVPEEPLCPYHTDYLPIAQGFGCDATVLAPRTMYPPVELELQGVVSLVNRPLMDLSVAEELAAFEQEGDLLTGTQSSSSAPAPSPVSPAHQTEFGCTATARPVRHALPGSFAIEEDTLSLLRRFLNRRIKEGESRRARSDLEEPPPGTPTDPFTQDERGVSRLLARTWGRIQGAFEAAIFPQAVDAPLTLTRESPLRAPVARLAKLAADRQGGLREFTKSYAYFLLRSCMFRPCRAKLTQTIKMADADACFPYTNGEFLDDTEANPRWRQCAEAAEIDLEGGGGTGGGSSTQSPSGSSMGYASSNAGGLSSSSSSSSSTPTEKHVVYVHGICEHTTGFSDAWWAALRTFTPSIPDSNRHEVVWSNIVNGPNPAPTPEEAALSSQIAAMAQNRLGAPLPATFRQCIDNVSRYLANPAKRAAVLQVFDDTVRPLLTGGNTVEIISHSWGSIVAYEALVAMDPIFSTLPGRVHTLFSVGSPLSIDEITPALIPTAQDGHRPSIVQKWINLNAQFDPIGGPLSGYSVDQQFLNLMPVGCPAPDPACAHSSYFNNGNLTVNQNIFGENIEL